MIGDLGGLNPMGHDEGVLEHLLCFIVSIASLFLVAACRSPQH